MIQNIQTEQSHFVGYYNGYSAPFTFRSSRIGSYPRSGEAMFRFGQTASWIEISEIQTGLNVAAGAFIFDLRATNSNLRLFLKQNRWGDGPQPAAINPAARGSGARVSFIGEMGHQDFTSTVY